jgi:hypothetical protein
MVYKPAPFVTVSRLTLVPVFVATTMAPGITAPPWSTTRPLNEEFT